MIIEALLLSLLTRSVISLMPFRVLTSLMRVDKVDYRGRVNGNNTIYESSGDKPSDDVSSGDEPSKDVSSAADSSESDEKIRIYEQIQTFEQVRMISESILKVSNNAFWNATCLVQASSGMIMLKRRNISGRLYLGVNKENNGAMKPHAWLETGGEVILGGGELEKYVIVSVFA